MGKRNLVGTPALYLGDFADRLPAAPGINLILRHNTSYPTR
jgi:hypothetical protein